MKSHKNIFRYIEGERPWKNIEKVDVVLPCATQNEVYISLLDIYSVLA